MLALLLTLAVTGNPPSKPAVNVLCPVCAGEVDKDTATADIRGQQYRLCCTPCEEPLSSKPEDYLNADGSPKNAPTCMKKPVEKDPWASGTYMPDMP
jgi:YHS domain-containing protein